MKKQNLVSFAAGMATTALLFTCVAGTMAAGGGVSFNTARVILGHGLFADEGQTVQTAAGAEIPSTILYTDSNGGGTLYAPLRPMMEAIGAEVTWDRQSNEAKVKLDPAAALYTMRAEFSGEVSVGCFKEIAPIVPTGGTVLVPTTRHQSAENYIYELPAFDPAKGETVTVTVTNHGTKPIQSFWGFTTSTTDVTARLMQIPAGATLSRTFQLIAPLEDEALYFNMGNPEGMNESRDFEVTITQFSTES